MWFGLGFGVQGMYYVQNLVFSYWIAEMESDDDGTFFKIHFTCLF